MSRHAIEALAWALVNFVWQGAIVGAAAAAACARLRKARPQARYLVLTAALAVMAAAPPLTAIYVVGGAEDEAIAPMGTPPPVGPGTPATAPSSVASHPSGSSWLVLLVACWSGIAALLSIRSLGGWCRVRRLACRGVTPVPAIVAGMAERLEERLGVRRRVRVVGSVAAGVPGVVGSLRPVILIPAGLLVSLTQEQLEQILAHELAHVRRHDYLVNLFQTAVENVLFYHPAVWWVSGRMRVEREHCCDDLAVATCGDPVGYARTLARLEELREPALALVLAASGGALLDRVRRLLRQPAMSRPMSPVWIGASVPMAAVLVLLLTGTPPQAETAAPAPEPKPAKAGQPAPKGYLAGLTAAGYTQISVEDIIRLKTHGVEPAYIKDMLAAGLGSLNVEQLIRLRTHGVSTEFVAGAVASGLVGEIDVENAIRLRENGVSTDDMRRIREMGFGPYAAGDVIRLRHNGVDTSIFEVLKDLGAMPSPVDDAIALRHAGVTPSTLRGARSQGFDKLTVEQLLKLRRAGII